MGNDMSTRRIYFYASHSLSKNSWNELGFRRTGGSLPVGPLAPPIVPCLCCEPTRDLPGTPSLLSSRHPESIPKPQSSTITLMLCHSGGTLENSQQSAGAAQAWQNGPNRPNWMTGTYLHISRRPQLQNPGQFCIFRDCHA